MKVRAVLLIGVVAGLLLAVPPAPADHVPGLKHCEPVTDVLPGGIRSTGAVAIRASGTDCVTARKLPAQFIIQVRYRGGDPSDLRIGDWRCEDIGDGFFPNPTVCTAPGDKRVSWKLEVSKYFGYVGAGDRAVRRQRGQGGTHKLILQNPRLSRVRRYRVCIRGGSGDLGRCFVRRLRHGYNAVEASLLINDQGGLGRYRVRWFVAGRIVTSWRFRLMPEGV